MKDEYSIPRLMSLHPKLRDEAVRVYNKAVAITPVGVHPFITQGYRTFAESDALYQQGRTKPGPIVTNARAGASFHNYGLAFDFVLIINDKQSWTIDDNWMKVVNVFKAEGWEWGGDWHSFKDFPHLQKTFGYTWQQLLEMHNSGKVDSNGFVLF